MGQAKGEVGSGLKNRMGQQQHIIKLRKKVREDNQEKVSKKGGGKKGCEMGKIGLLCK